MPALASVLASGLLALTPPVGSRAYVVLLDGTPDGAAALEVRAVNGDQGSGALRFDWRAEIGVSASPCLTAIESRHGRYLPALDPIPDELAIPLAVAGGGRVTGRIRGERFIASGRRGELPDRVELPDLGLVYAAVPPAQLTWGRCWPGGLDRSLPLEAPGAGDPRGWRQARFEVVGAGLPALVSSAVGAGVLPAAAAGATRALFRTAGRRDCRAVASALASRLQSAGLQARVVAGLLVADGRLWPHAWTEVRLDGRWQALDATTGPGLADAGRIRVGVLEEDGSAGRRAKADRGATGLALLRYRRARVRLLP